MTERPIIFSAPMVRAILDGRKTQTRRIIKLQRPWLSDGDGSFAVEDSLTYTLHFCADSFIKRFCPFGDRGDRLWVKEAWQFAPKLHCVCPQPSEASPCDDWQEGLGCRSDRTGVIYQSDGMAAARWRPASNMPRWASRIALEVTDVRVQRVQDISDEDVAAEGAPGMVAGRYQCRRCNGQGSCLGYVHCTACGGSGNDAAWHFAAFWDSINAKRAPWGSNPWVWAVSFRRVR